MIKIQRLFWVGCVLIFSIHIPTTTQTHFICGADVSSLAHIEADGGMFYDENGDVQTDLLTYLKTQGVNMIRLRLWHTPADDIYGLDYNLALAKRIHALDMGILLDFHYSDTWADPANQTKPAAWADLSFTELRGVVYDYTTDVMKAFMAQNTPPAMVQIGNEISGGMLWDTGRVRDEQGWSHLIGLLNAGVDAVREISPDTQIMIHLDTGGNRHASVWFFDHIISAVDFDIIGLSYYPWWSGRLTQLSANINILVHRYEKPIIIVETAYPWTLAWADDVHNPVGTTDQVLADYPATPYGQRDFLQAVIQIIQNTPDDLGMGFFYWEPAFIPTSQRGSPWENLTQFDFDGRVLPSIQIYQTCLS